MDVYLKEKANGSSRFAFPSLPEKIKVKKGTNYQSYNIIGKGVVKVPKGMEDTTISWEGVFHGKAKRSEAIIRSWVSPRECKRILDKWMEDGTELNLIVTETNINFDVTIADFSYEEFGAHGSADYNISFCVSKELKIYTTDELKIAALVKPRPTPAPSKTYTVVSGDNLWKIARKFYGGSGSDWQKIYNANKDVIESTARRYGKSSSNNGWWIYPGTQFVIP